MPKKLIIIFYLCTITFCSAGKAFGAIDSLKKEDLTCDLVRFELLVSNISNFNATIDFGDGSPVVSMSDSAGSFWVFHFYNWVGVYDAKARLYQNNVEVDSVVIQHERQSEDCGQASNFVFVDENNNCVKDINEQILSVPLQVEISSTLVAPDTLSFFGGFNYVANSMMGDIYTFKILSLPSDFTFTCPSNGIISNELQSQGNSFQNQFGVTCSSFNNFDLAVREDIIGTGVNRQGGYLYVRNPLCYTPNAVISLIHSPKYQYLLAEPAPTSVNGNVVTWNFSDLGATNIPSRAIYFLLDSANGFLTMGDTVHTKMNTGPVVGDVDPVNNSLIVVDTVVGPYDPNAIYVDPEGCVPAGANLNYKITFENLGNGPAENVFVLDTLPQGLVESSLKMVFSSHNMFVTKRNFGSFTVLRFDFPNIMLADSSDHVGRHGMFEYTIDADANLSVGSGIDHRVGIYFDHNEVVLTNTASTEICWPAIIEQVQAENSFITYPNPVTDILTIRSEDYESFEVINTLGQLMLEGKAQQQETKISMKNLPPGIYSVKLIGAKRYNTAKIQKL